MREMDDGTIIPEEQNIPDWCILCPRNRYLKDHSFAHIHYLCMHHKKLLVVNQHFHCCVCFHPFKAGDSLATHMITSHTEIDLSQVCHLMRENNPHRYYDYEKDD